MNYTVVDLQARVNALGYVDPIDVDGMKGPATRKAVGKTKEALNIHKDRDLFHESGLHRIHWHWTGGTYTVNAYTRKHYNDVHDFEGNSYDGAARAEHQANYDWRKGIGVSHTRNSNTGCIGQAVAAMHSADGWPVDWGDFPLTWEGIDAMLERSAEYAKEFWIPVSKWSTLGHAEVQPNLGIVQKGKWDFRILPGMDHIISAVEAGDILRARMKEKFM